MVIMHNMSAVNAAGKVTVNEKKTAKSAEKLGSGYRINRSADDAAGLTISEKMRWQARGLGRASDNSKDGISYIQTAEGALTEMHSMLDRCKELCVQAANDSNVASDREAIQKELDQLTAEIDSIADHTTYNTRNVFSIMGQDPHTYANAAAASGTNSVDISWSYIDSTGTVQTPSSSHANATANYTGNMKTIADYVAAEASKAANAIMSAYPSLAGGCSPDIKIGLSLKNIDGKNGVLASAALSMQWTSSSSAMKYTLNVDTSDYNIGNYNNGSLSATLTHEMTHLIMQDALTAGMLGKNSEPYPLWFIEGMAQTSSGDNGWMSSLNAGSSNAQIKNYLSQVSSMPYGAGYLGTMYLAQMASGASGVTTASLRSGIDTILGKLVAGDTLSTVIKDISGGKYANYKDFQKNVANDANAIQFTKDFIAARSANGAGSVIAPNLTTQVPNILDGVTGYTGGYTVDTTTTSYTNIFGTGFDFPDGGVPAGGDEGLILQIGETEGQEQKLTTFDVSSAALFQGQLLDVGTHADASKSITRVDSAIEAVSKVRAYYGAMQNRLESTVANLDNTQENVQAAESRIRDTDMAEEMVAYSNGNILAQAAQSMLAQANHAPDAVLQLLQA